MLKEKKKINFLSALTLWYELTLVYKKNYDQYLIVREYDKYTEWNCTIATGILLQRWRHYTDKIKCEFYAW